MAYGQLGAGITENKDKLNNQFQDFDQDEQDHSIIWTTFTNREPEGSEYEKFLNGDWNEKKKVIFRYALDADDALFRSKEMMRKYATGKFDPEEMNPIGILRSVKKAGIQTRSNFLIGFRDESWESIVRTKEFVKELFAEGLDQAAFSIPVPYPGTLDFEFEMRNPDQYKDFNENLLKYTDRMHIRERPLFRTKVPGKRLQEAVRDFWQELNASDYVNKSMS